jgi:hypothetical protein
MKKMMLAMTILGLAAATLVPTAKADGYYGRGGHGSYHGRGGYNSAYYGRRGYGGYYGRGGYGGYYGSGGYYFGAPVGAYCAPAWPVPAPAVCAPGVTIVPPVFAAPSVRIGLPLPPLPLPGFHGFFGGPFGFFHHGHR